MSTNHFIYLQYIVFLLFGATTSGIPLFSASTHLIPVPSHDSAVIKFDRMGGRFAYSTIEGHAFETLTPIFQNVASSGILSEIIAAPIVSNKDPKAAYALESATLPKEHRGLPLNYRTAPLSSIHHNGHS